MSEAEAVDEASKSTRSLEYVVRFGSMRTLGVMSSRQSYRYGDEVVAKTTRGTEIGTVLCEATPNALDSMNEPTEGRIVRRLTEDDRAQWRHLEGMTRDDLQVCTQCV
ncbi:MAG: signal peptidase, partial [Planctomycetes bacterium]|nr:signal peptidase [Planctomycetota bacterium]